MGRSVLVGPRGRIRRPAISLPRSQVAVTGPQLGPAWVPQATAPPFLLGFLVRGRLWTCLGGCCSFGLPVSSLPQSFLPRSHSETMSRFLDPQRFRGLGRTWTGLSSTAPGPWGDRGWHSDSVQFQKVGAVVSLMPSLPGWGWGAEEWGPGPQPGGATALAAVRLCLGCLLPNFTQDPAIASGEQAGPVGRAGDGVCPGGRCPRNKAEGGAPHSQPVRPLWVPHAGRPGRSQECR